MKPFPIAAFLFILVAGPLAAQSPRTAGLNAYLDLSAAQMVRLRQLRHDSSQAIQPVVRQIESKQALLEAARSDGDRYDDVYRLESDVAALRLEIAHYRQRYEAAAESLLTGDQKAQLDAWMESRNRSGDEGPALLSIASGHGHRFLRTSASER